jgi:hypothetical protein
MSRLPDNPIWTEPTQASDEDLLQKRLAEATKRDLEGWRVRLMQEVLSHTSSLLESASHKLQRAHDMVEHTGKFER